MILFSSFVSFPIVTSIEVLTLLLTPFCDVTDCYRIKVLSCHTPYSGFGLSQFYFKVHLVIYPSSVVQSMNVTGLGLPRAAPWYRPSLSRLTFLIVHLSMRPPGKRGREMSSFSQIREASFTTVTSLQTQNSWSCLRLPSQRTQNFHTNRMKNVICTRTIARCTV